MNILRKLLWPGLAAAIALAVLLSLGAWQLRRLHEKEAQLSALDAAIVAEPLALSGAVLARLTVLPPGGAGGTPDQIGELTRVRLIGAFLGTRSVPVRATLPATRGSTTSGIGYFWMTPLKVDDGPVVFINRGFVSSGGDWKAPAIATPAGPQVITGLLRKAEAPRPFVPADDPAKGEFFTRDPALMARAIAIDPANVAGYFIDAERAPSGAVEPMGVDAREMIARIPNNHLQYAVTWFGLALTLVGVFGAFARARWKELM